MDKVRHNAPDRRESPMNVEILAQSVLLSIGPADEMGFACER